jgi:hypothetical protein
MYLFTVKYSFKSLDFKNFQLYHIRSENRLIYNGTDIKSKWFTHTMVMHRYYLTLFHVLGFQPRCLCTKIHLKFKKKSHAK